ncbi:hypothetical protein CDAR_585401 [Caerostris darwini]|uniref:Uncharacterized protein n=1 Tax=Caerostris darwini TaxID=1538125 RepID=A0AAV4X1F4_9ARAC|nr:hypothetical protein CDAR_585401 [Caerostris darwini]
MLCCYPRPKLRRLQRINQSPRKLPDLAPNSIENRCRFLREQKEINKDNCAERWSGWEGVAPRLGEQFWETSADFLDLGRRKGSFFRSHYGKRKQFIFH